MEHEVITSRRNPLCAHLRKLASSRTYREETGEFLCDSPKLLREAKAWSGEISAVVYTQGADPGALQDIREDKAIRRACVTQSVMEFVSPMRTPQGVVFSCRRRAESLRLPERLSPGRYLVLDGVQDPGNVGTILRTADAFDCDGVFLLPGCADLYSPKTVRAGMGVHFRRAIYPCTLEQLYARLQKGRVPLYAAALRDDTLDVRAADLGNCAVVIGSEGRGVSQTVLALCEKTVKIPMSPRCESLNAAVAASVVLWEMAREAGI